MVEMSGAGLGRNSMMHTAGLQKQIGYRGTFKTSRDGVEAPAGRRVEQQLSLCQAAKGNSCVRWPRETFSMDLGRR